MDSEIIKARREAIENDARCDGCGATRALCEKLRRENTDPTAPPWFGCCAREMGLVPCHHTVNAGELLRLVKQIEDDSVTSVDDELLDSITEFPLYEDSRRGRSLRARVMGYGYWPDDVPMPGEF
jgi:hypothetical protein